MMRKKKLDQKKTIRTLLAAIAVKKKPCGYCGKKFMPRTRWQVYCSLLCGGRKRHGVPMVREEKTCGHCGDKFTPGVRAPGQIYCSPVCGDRKRHGVVWVKKEVEAKVCRYCGGVFMPTQPTQQIYCRRNCAERGRREHATKRDGRDDLILRRQRYKENRDRINATRRQNPEGIKRWKKLNRVRVRETTKRWWAKNRDRCNALRKQWRANNPEQVRLQRQRYKLKNHERMKVKRRERYNRTVRKQWYQLNKEKLTARQRQLWIENRERNLIRSRKQWAKRRDVYNARRRKNKDLPEHEQP